MNEWRGHSVLESKLGYRDIKHRDQLSLDEIHEELRRIMDKCAYGRVPGESFGDFCL